jgi:hypothetical protein
MHASLIRRLTATILAVGCTWASPPAAVAQENRPLERNPPRPPETATEPQGFLIEPSAIQRAVIFGDRHFANGELTEGWYVDSWNMIPGAGWISLGPGYRRWYSKDRVFTDSSAAISWHGYKTAQARVDLPRLARSRLLVGSQLRWQDFPQVAFFGEGADSIASNRSEYRLESANLVGYATFRPIQWLGIGVNAGWLSPSIESRGGFFKRDEPDTRLLFPGDPVFAVSGTPAFVHTEASITADTRDFAGHPTRGGLYRAAAAGFSDRGTGVFSFKRYEIETAQFVPLADSRVVLGLRGWLAASDTNDGQIVPFYLQPSLGGHNSLRSYPDYRFHDRNLMLVNLETRVAMMTHVDAVVFFDAGNVAARAADLNLDKRSYGVGLRLHSRRQTFARLDVARGSEGWRVVVHLSDPLNLARLSRRTAAVPFVP